jgi:hypothetical protein
VIAVVRIGNVRDIGADTNPGEIDLGSTVVRDRRPRDGLWAEGFE